MKQRKHLFSAVLTMLCLTLLCMAFGAGSARAETALQSDDGWLYCLTEEGSAQIVGHADVRATELTVPVSLGGAWVTSIGENAFADNAALAKLTIPATVLSIDGSAFAENASLTLCAHNGTRALRYAQEAGMPSVNLSEYDFFEDVLDLSGMSAGDFTLSGTSLTVNAPYDALLTVGAKLFLPPNGAYHAGYTAQVVSVEAGENAARAQVTELDFADAVRSYHADNLVVNLDPKYFTPAAGVTVLPSLSATERGAMSGSVNLPLKLLVNHKINNNFSIQGSVGLDVGLSLSVHYEDFEVKSYSQTFSANPSIDVKIVGEAAYEVLLGSYAAPVVGPVNVSFKLMLKVSASGEMGIRAEQTIGTTTTWDINTGARSRTNADRAVLSSANIDGNVTSRVSISPGIALGFGGLSVDIAWMEAYVQFVGAAKYNSLAPYCNDISINLEAGADLYIGARAGKDAYPIFGGNVYNVSREIGHWHLEGVDEIVQDECTYEGICTVSFVTGGDPIEPMQFAAGSQFTGTPIPTRFGYSFDRWYTDPALTVPFVGTAELPSGAVTLYAGWFGDRTTYAPQNQPSATPPPPQSEDNVTPSPTPAPTGTPGWMIPDDWGNAGVGKPDEIPELSGNTPNYIYFSVDDEGYATIYHLENHEWTPVGGSYYFESKPFSSFTVPAYVDNTWERYAYEAVFGDPFDQNEDGDYEYLYTNRYIDESIPYKQYPVRGVSNINVASLTIPTGVTHVTLSGSALQHVSIGSGVEEISISADNLQSVSILDAGKVSISSSYAMKSITVHNVDSLHISHLPNLTSLTVTNDDDHRTNLTSDADSLNALKTMDLQRTLVSNGFNYMDNLETVTMDDCSISNAFYGCPKLTTVRASATTYDETFDIAFNNCPGITTLDLDHKLYLIRSFNGGDPNTVFSIRTRELPSTSFDTNPLHVTVVRDNGTGVFTSGFTGRENLLSVEYEGDGAMYFHPYAFKGCTGLRRAVIPGDVSIMPDQTLGQFFTGCRDVALTISGSDTILDYFGRYLCKWESSETDIFSSITIGSDVKSIGEGAFYDFTSLGGSLILNEGLEEIGDEAFAWSCISSVSIPSTVKTIGDSAFYRCTELAEVTLGENGMTIGNYAFYGAGKLKSVHIPAAAANWEGYGVFGYNTELETVSFAGDLTTIPAALFTLCTNLTNVTLPSGLQEIGLSAFYGAGLTEIEIPRSVTSIGRSAFAGCPITELEIPSWEIEYGSDVFSGTDIKEITIPGHLETIPDAMFDGCIELTTVRMEPGVKVIGKETFANCQRLKEIDFPSGLTEIGNQAFYQCYALADLNLPSSLTTIDEWAFSSCDSLQRLILPEGLTTIAKYAFYFTPIASIDLPASLTQVGDYALYSYFNLKSLTVRNPQMQFAERSFSWPDWYVHDMIVYADEDSTIAQYIRENVNDDDAYVLIVPVDSQIFSAVFFKGEDTNWSQHTTQTAYSGTLLSRPEAPIRSNCTFTGWYREPECINLWDFDTDRMPAENLMLYSGWETQNDAVICPEDDGLRYDGPPSTGSVITVPGSVNGVDVVSIGASSVPYNCITFNIPATVRRIDPGAFAKAEWITTVTVDENNPWFCAIDGVLFSADGTLLYYPCGRTDDTYTTPEGTTAIASGAFSGTKLKSIVFSESVRNLENGAIGMNDALEQVTFMADPVSIDAGAINLITELTVDGPAQAPVLDAYLLANGADRSLRNLYFEADGYIFTAFRMPAGELIPADAVPSGDSMDDPERLLLGWSATAEADNLWNFSADVMPDSSLTLHAVWQDAYEWEFYSNSNLVMLLKYNGTSRHVEIPYMYKGYQVSAIAADCFGDPSDLTLTGEAQWIVQNWVSNYGGTYEPLLCTVYFSTGCDVELDPVTVEIGTTIELPAITRYGYQLWDWEYLNQENKWADCYTSLTVMQKKIVLHAYWYEDDSYATAENLYAYTVTDEGAVITGLRGSVQQADIPATLGGAAVVAIGDNAFADTTIAGVTMPDTVAHIGSGAFRNCDYLTDVTLSGGLVSIGESAFYECSQLKTLTIPQGVTSLPDYVLASCVNLTELHLPASLTELSETALYSCRKLASLTLADGSAAFVLVDNVLYSADCKILVFYPAGKTDAMFAVPKGVTTIADSAMRGSRIQSLTIPESLTAIGADALRDSRILNEISFPESGRLVIGEGAFGGCIGLKEVTLAKGVVSIGNHAFEGCKLMKVTFGGDGVTLADDALPVLDDQIACANAGSAGADWAQANGVILVKPGDVLPTFIILPEELYLKVGESVQLEPAFEPADATLTGVRWEVVKSTTGGTVTVSDDGLVTAWKEGDAYVKGCIPGGEYETVTIHVFKSEADVKHIELSETYVELRVGATKPLTAELKPFGEEEILWETTDEAIAVYDEERGCIVAVGAGEAAITAFTEDGVRSTCVVSVKGNTETNGPIRLSVSSFVVEPGDDCSLYAWIEDPVHAEDIIHWEISDPDAFYFESFGENNEELWFCPLEIGEYEITACTEGGYAAVCTVEVLEYVPRLTLTTEYLEIGAGWNTSGLQVHELPDTSSSVTWTSSNPDIAYYNAEKGRVIGLQLGEAILIAATDDGYTASCYVVVERWAVLNLPSALREVEEEAFAGSTVYYCECNEGLERIGSRAFAENRSMVEIYIPASVTYIAPDAFEGCWNLVYIDGVPGSYAESYAEEHGYYFYAVE